MENNYDFTTDGEESPATYFYGNASSMRSPTVGSVSGRVVSTIYSLEVVVGLSVMVSIVIFLTVFGNALVILSFITTKKLRTYNNYFILSLAVADFIVGAIDMPLFSIVFITGKWPFGEIFCDIFTFLDHTFAHISIVLVTIVSLDRCVALSCPFYHRQHWHRRSRANLLIATGYLVPIIIWLPLTTLWQFIHGKSSQVTISSPVCEPRYLDSVSLSFVVPCIYLFIPFAVTCVLCTKIYVIIRKHHARMMIRKARHVNAYHSEGQTVRDVDRSSIKTTNMQALKLNEMKNPETSKRDRTSKTAAEENENVRSDNRHKVGKENTKGLKTLAFVVGAMAIAWFPSVVVIITSSFCADCLPGIVYSVTVFWGYMNSMMNPICYALSDRAFKNAFIRILRVQCLHDDRGAGLSLKSSDL